MSLFENITEYMGTAVVVGIILLIVFSVFSGFNTRVQSMDASLVDNTTKEASSDFQSNFNKLDFVMAFLYFGVLIASAFIVRQDFTDPKLFIIITIVGMVFFGFGGMILENVWNGFSSNSAMSGLISSFPFTNFFLNNMLVFVLAYFFVVSISFFTKDSYGVGV